MVTLQDKLAVIATQQSQFISWYNNATAASKDVARKEGKTYQGPMGPGGIEHEALEQMKGVVYNLDVLHTGLEAIAPDIDDQTVYVLNELSEASSAIISDIKIFFQLFDSFAREGPEMQINKMNQGSRKKWFQKRLIDFTNHLSELSRKTSQLYISHGKIKNAIAMLQLQQKIAKKHTKFSEKVSPRQIAAVLRPLKEIDSSLHDIQASMESLQDEVRKVQLSKGTIYPLYVSTRQGNVRLDKLYFMVITKYIDALIDILQVVPQVEKVLEGIDSITTPTSVKDKFKAGVMSKLGRGPASTTDTAVHPILREFFGLPAPKTVLITDQQNKTIRNTLNHISKKAFVFDGYEEKFAGGRSYSGRGQFLGSAAPTLQLAKDINKEIKSAMNSS